MAEKVSPAEQVKRVATLLGRAVLRWKCEKEQSSEISEIVSDSLPERLEFSPVSSLSVTGQNDEAPGLEETSSESETNPNNFVRGVTNKDRDLKLLRGKSAKISIKRVGEAIAECRPMLAERRLLDAVNVVAVELEKHRINAETLIPSFAERTGIVKGWLCRTSCEPRMVA